MRIQFGNVPEDPGLDPEAEGLHPIRSPQQRMGTLLASLAGFVLLIFPLMTVCLVLSYFAIPAAGPVPPHSLAPWLPVVLALLFYIPLHESFHLVFHPRSGTSDQSILVIWPVKLVFGVYYEGCMSRSRWLLMRFAPFTLLSLLPAAFLAIFQNIFLDIPLRTFLEVIMVVNGVGSGGDVIGMLLVLSQVPRAAVLCFHGGRAYWKRLPPDSEAASPSLPFNG
jgi:hypothetical protein